MKVKWKQKAIACVTALALVGTMLPQNPFGVSWNNEASAETVLPTPTYLFDFENQINQNGASAVTNGTTGKVEIVEDTDKGKVLHITDGGTEFFGQNYYKLPADVFKGVTNETGATVSMWVKIPATIAHEWSVLFNSTPKDYNEWGLWKINANLVTNVNAGTPQAWGDTESVNLTKDTWHNVTSTLTKEKLNVYLDGKLMASVDPNGADTYTGPLEQFTTNAFNVLGAGGFPTDNGVTSDRDISDCYYDDVAIYPVALTNEQVKKVYDDVVKVQSIVITPNTETVTNEYIYASEEDKNNGKISVSKCGFVQLEAKVQPSIAVQDVTWSIADADINKATVNESGLVTLTDKVKDKETVTVYATATDGSGVKGSCTITASVNERTESTSEQVTNISIADQSLQVGWISVGGFIEPKNPVTPEIQYTPQDPIVKEVVFETENTDIIEIQGNKIIGLKTGEATVKATSKSGSKVSTTFKVQVSGFDKLGDLTLESFNAQGAFGSGDSNFERITGDFDIIYTFNSKISDTGDYRNFAFELADNNNNWLTLRDDKVGWGSYFTDSEIDSAGDSATTEDMKNAGVIAHIIREGNKITVKYRIEGKESGKVYNISVIINYSKEMAQDLYVRLTGEKVAVSEIKLTENTPFDLICKGNATLSDSAKGIKIGDSVTFTAEPLTGYEISKVVYDGEELEKDADGNYTIPFIINNTEAVEITTTTNKYSISYIIDGKEEKPVEFTVEDADQQGKISLKAVSEGMNGWYLSDDKTDKITEIDVKDLVNWENNSLTVYGYNPYKISMNKDNPTSFENGTIEELDTSKSYYMGDKVVIVTKPKKGFAANVKVTTAESGEEIEVTSETGATEDEQNVTFIMPASNVMITYGEFTGIDRSKIEAAIAAAKAIYDAGNADSAYTAATWDDFKKAYDDAVAANANSEASQAILDTAQKALETAQKALTYVYKVTLDKESETIEVGENFTLTAAVTTAGEDKSVTWSSSDEKIATVADGKVTGIAAGEATITATAADGVTTATCKVTVNAPITYEVKLDKESAAVKVGDTVVLTATVTTNGTDKSVTWSSSDEKVATVADGKVTAIAAGKATITATAADKAAKATCEITVTEKDPEPVIPEGKSYLFDFEGEITKDGATPVTNGTTGKVEIVEDAERGKVLHITDGGTESFGQNYYKLPEDVFKGVTAETGATVAMWTKIPSEIKSEWSVLFQSSAGYNQWHLWKFNVNRVADINAGEPNVWGSTVNTGTTGDGYTPVEKDKWHHIATTLSKDLLNVYLDGVLIGTTPATGGENYESLGWSDALNQLAKNPFNTLGSGGFPGDGKTGDRDISDCYYDDVAIYPTALTAEEIKNLCTKVPIKVTKVTVTPATAEAVNEYVYDSEADKEAGIVQASRFGTVQLSASVEPSNADVKEVTWSINEADAAKATVDEKGLVTLTDQAKDGDTITVYATAKDESGVKGSSVITVSVRETVGPAKTEELTAAIAAAKPVYDAGNADNTYTDISWNEFKNAYEAAVAVAAKDVVTQGEVDEAKDALQKAQEGLAYQYAITLDKEAETIKVGESITLTATVTTAAEDKSVTWSSSDEKIATVENGKVTAVAAGEAVITATAADKETTASCKVTVIAETEEPVIPEKPVLPEGWTYFFDFEDGIDKNGASPITNGTTGKVEIVEDAEKGKVLHITDGGTESFGQNYYKLPTDIFKGVTKETGATVSMWVKIPAAIAHEWSVLFNSTPENYNEWGLWKINANLVTNVNAGTPQAWGDTESADLTKDTWHNVTSTLTKEKLNVYLDGKLIASVDPNGADTYAGPLEQFAANAFNVLGAGGFPTEDGKTGDRDISDCYYDDIVIYPTALTAEEVKQLYTGVPAEDDQPVAPTGISLDKTELTMKAGESQTLTASITPENATNKDVKWSSDNESIATVDGNGKVTAIAAGSTVIRATAVSDASITAGCAITVTQEQTGGNTSGSGSGSSGGTTNTGSSSSGNSTNTGSTNTGNQGTNPPDNGNNDNNTVTPPSTTTKPDGTVVETSKETTADGTVKETVKETAVDGAVKETITETATNGTVKETVTETTADKNVTKEMITETATNGKVTVAATVTDNKNAAVLNTVVEKDANGNITKVDAVILAGAADVSVSGKKASVTVNVSDVIMNAAAENDGVDSVVIEITKPVLSAAYANKNVTNGVTVNVNIDATDNVAVSGIILTSESIAEAKAAGQKLTVNVITGDADKADYKVVIPASQLKKITDTTKPVDILVETIAATKITNDSSKGKVSTDVKDVLAKNKAKQERTYVLSIADNESMKAGMKVTAKVNKDTAISAKQTVYVYKYNEKTGKFVEVANSKQKVSADGTVTIDAKSGTDYVVSSKKLSGSKVTTIKSKVKATVEKSSIKAGKSISIDVTLPSELKKVKSFGGSSTFGKEQAIVLYESSNNKVASVTAKGTIKAKKAGKAIITVTVGMEGGQTKKIKKAITVK